MGKGQFVGLDWNCISRLHSQVMPGTRVLTNCGTVDVFRLLIVTFFGTQDPSENLHMRRGIPVQNISM